MSDPASTIAAQEHAAEDAWLSWLLSGPTRTRWTALPVQVGDPAPDLALQDSTGARRQLSECWSSGPALLVFMRHFGCSCLRERWDSLEPALGTIRDAGASIHLIGQGEPERTAAVADRRGYPTPVWCDPACRLRYLRAACPGHTAPGPPRLRLAPWG
jgi:hypothetical protein